jgi:hypothetical protein
MKLSDFEEGYQISGRQAFEKGTPIDGCPYPARTGCTDINAKRVQWMIGWLDSRTWTERGTMLRKYGFKDERPSW